MNTFQIGDKVKIIKDKLGSMLLGRVGTVTAGPQHGDMYQIQLDKKTEFGAKYWFDADELEKVAQ